MLSEIVKKDYVQLDIEARDFETAIRLSMEPLLIDKAVTKLYVEKAIEILHDIGPYIVITKHIAMPHAPEDAGSKKLAVGFTRLKREVISGNDANDPVNYLFALSTIGGEEHLSVLSELASLFSNKEFLECMNTVETPQEFIESLKKMERND